MPSRARLERRRPVAPPLFVSQRCTRVHGPEPRELPAEIAAPLYCDLASTGLASPGTTPAAGPRHPHGARGSLLRSPVMHRPHGAALRLAPFVLALLAPSAAAQVAPPGCAGLTTTTLGFSDPTPVLIPDATSTATIGWGTTQTAMFVFGLDPYLWDIDVQLNLQHQRSNDLKVYLSSPSAHQITLTTDNNLFGFPGIFNGTLWDDSALVPVTDYPFVSGVAAPAVVPEQAMGAFIGEDPNGIWTLTLRDDTPGNTGLLDGWSMQVTSLSAAPTGQNAGWFQNVNQVIPDGSMTGVASTITVTG